jgi:uncharacterized protein YjbJ (UPF0337 family)
LAAFAALRRTPPNPHGVTRMNEDIIKGKWTQIKGSLKSKWGKLTDDDLDRIDGNHQYLVGKLQERYGWQKEQSEREIRDFEHSLNKKAA